MNLLFWNVRGLSKLFFKPNFILLMQQHHYHSLVVLAEAWVGHEKIETIIRDMRYDSWYLLELLGFAGGILMLWKSHILDFQVIGEGAQRVYGVVEVISNKFSLVITSVYACTIFKLKMLWKNLVSFAQNSNKPWLVLCDRFQ